MRDLTDTILDALNDEISKDGANPHDILGALGNLVHSLLVEFDNPRSAWEDWKKAMELSLRDIPNKEAAEAYLRNRQAAN